MAPLDLPDPHLSDGVVALRVARPGDAEQIVAALRDPDIVRWTRVPPDYTDADFAAYLERSARQRAAGTSLSMLIVDAADHATVVGSCGLHEVGSERPDIGYWVARGFRGQGVAPRALGLVRDHALGAVGLPRVHVLVHADNAPSQRVAEKAGFMRTGVVRVSPRRGPGEPRPELVEFGYPPV
jgi:RimJ/RimL family protein N-acetyltransferase